MWPRATQGICKDMLQLFLYAIDMGWLSDRRSGLYDVLMGVEEVALTCGKHINQAQACVLAKIAFDIRIVHNIPIACKMDGSIKFHDQLVWS